MALKRSVIFLSLVISILIIGCGGTKNNQPTAIDYRVGSEGLALSFPQGTPQQIFENDIDVRIPVEIENRGAFPQYDELSEFTGFLWIGGFDPNIMQALFEEGDIRVQLNPEELEGKTPINTQGGITMQNLLISVGDLPQGTAVYEPTLIYTLTYLYKSIAAPVICVDPQPRSINVKDKVCSLADYRKTYGVPAQGGPVAVTSVEQTVTSSQMAFIINIQNVGNGQVIERDLVQENPNEGYDWREMNRVYIDDVRLGDVTVDRCKPDMGEAVELYNGIGKFQCTVSMASLPSIEAYTTPLTVTLSYGYKYSQFSKIKILEAVEI